MVVQLIVILIILGLGVYIISSGTNFLDDFAASAQERIDKQAEVPAGEADELINLAKDTGGSVCDLRITFYATMWDFNPFGADFLDPFSTERFIYHGDFGAGAASFISGTGTDGFAGDQRIFEYQWYNCSATSTASLLDIFRVNIRENTLNGLSIINELAFAGGLETDRELIRVHFLGESIDHPGKFLITPADKKGTPSNEFTSSIRLSRGDDFPAEYTITIRLLDVTEDNYVIEFWDENWRQNNEERSHRFDKDICTADTEFPPGC